MQNKDSHTEQKGWRERFIEEAAALEHARWARWQKYLHSKCDADAFGNLTIPRDSVVHWIRQIDTPYHNLSEQEKESDRKEVREYLPLIERTLQSQKEKKQRCGIIDQDGGVCEVILDCHLHDWRQREALIAYQEELVKKIDAQRNVLKPTDNDFSYGYNAALSDCLSLIKDTKV